MKWMKLLLIGCAVLSVNSQRTFLDDLIFRPTFRKLREFFFNFSRNTSPEEAFRMNLRMGKIQPQFSPNDSFFCDVNGPGRRSETVPTSVHKLRPGDIDIIGAIGDSLTAGNGGMALNSLGITIESKGVSFSIGGEKTWREYLTIPNILKEFNPNIYGYSVGDGLSIFKSSKFNVAELGAMSKDMPYNAKILVQRMKSDPKVKQSHWKLITILIGPNDFCLDLCYQKDPEAIVKYHENDLLKVFRTLKSSLQRTMLNVVLPPSMEVIVNFKGKPNECVSLHHFECPCFFGLRFQKYQQRYISIIRRWQEKVIEVVNREEFHDREDFTINVQPVVKNVVFPTLPNGLTDFTYLSFDCFHLSQKGYALASNGLWNNMNEAEGQKTETWGKLFEVFKCPTEQRPYLATRFN